VLFLLLILLGPAPLCLAIVVGLQRERRPLGVAGNSLVLLLSWFVMQAAIVLSLGIAHHLTRLSIGLTEIAVLGLGAAVLLRVDPGLATCVNRAFRPNPRLKWYEAMVTVGLLSLLLSLLCRSAVNPITNLDSLAYHMPAMATWYQSHSLEMPVIEWTLFSYYPYGWETISFLFLIPFAEDFPVALPNLGAWALLGLAIYCLGRDSGASRAAGLAAASLALTAPIVGPHVNTMEVDLALVAFVVAALYMGLRYVRLGSGAYLGLLLAAMGLAASVKTSGLIYAALLMLVVTAGRISARAARRAPQDARLSAPLFERAATVLGAWFALYIGGFWYLRNWLEVGNPFGPIAIRLGGLINLPGTYDQDHFRRSTLLSVFHPWSYIDWKILFGQIWEQFSFALLVFCLLVLAALVSLPLRRRQAAPWPLLGLVVSAGATWCLYIITPYSGDNGCHRWLVNAGWIGQSLRFAFPFWAMTAAAAAVAATMLGVWPVALAGLAVAGIATGFLALRMIYLLPLALTMVFWIVTACLPGWTRARIRSARSRRALSVAIAVVGLVAVTAGAFAARRERDRRRREAYGGIQHYVDEHVRPDEVIGHFMNTQSYLLYGRDFSRRVVYIPLKSLDRNEWLDHLEKQQITVIAVGPFARQDKAWDIFLFFEEGAMPVVRVVGSDFSKLTFLYRVAEEQSDAAGAVAASVRPPVHGFFVPPFIRR
jgi:hypothetical protein